MHFTIVVQQFSARDPGKTKKDAADLAMVINQEIVKEANKKGGLFDDYQKEPGSLGKSVKVTAPSTKTTAKPTTTTTTTTTTTKPTTKTSKRTQTTRSVTASAALSATHHKYHQ